MLVPPTLRSQDNRERPVGPPASETSHADALFDAAIDAGLAHELSWGQVKRILDQLPIENDDCPYCRGQLDSHGLPPGRAWRCRACGRITNERPAAHDDRPDKARAEEIGRAARESWAAVEARIAARSKEVA